MHLTSAVAVFLVLRGREGELLALVDDYFGSGLTGRNLVRTGCVCRMLMLSMIKQSSVMYMFRRVSGPGCCLDCGCLNRENRTGASHLRPGRFSHSLARLCLSLSLNA